MKTLLIVAVMAFIYMSFTGDNSMNDTIESNGHVPSGKYDDGSYPAYDNPKLYFDARKNEESSVTIKWKYTKNVQATCNRESKRKGITANFDHTTVACSFFGGSECTIITNVKTTTHSLGHEVRHCFQGAWHKW